MEYIYVKLLLEIVTVQNIQRLEALCASKALKGEITSVVESNLNYKLKTKQL